MVWNFLEKAKEKGQSFDQKLERSAGFSMTKWFDNLASHVKPICFAMAMATGAVACAPTAAHAADRMTGDQATIQTQIETIQDHVGVIGSQDSLHDQANYITSLAPSDVADLADHIKAPSATDMPQISMVEFSAQLAANGADVDVGDGMALENPYLEGHTIPMYASNDMGVHLKSLFSGETSLGVIKYAMTSDSPFALQNNFDNDSLASERSQTMIMMPDHMPGKGWTHGGNLEQDIAFTMYHEAAHTHMIQTLSKYDLSIDADEAGLSNESPYFVEAHADVTAAIATGKAYELSANEITEILEGEIAYTDQIMLGAMPGSDNYRSQQGYEVLVDMLADNPDLLSSIDEREIPLLAYDIVKQAGFDHSKAEVVLSSVVGELPEAAQADGYSQDRAALDQVNRAFPGNDILQEKTSALNTIWGEYNGARALGHLADNIEETLGYDLVADRQKTNMMATADQLADVHPDRDLATTIDAHVESVRNGDVSFAQGMAGLAGDLREAVNQAPTLSDVNAERTEVLADISDELTYQYKQGLLDDPLSHQSIGTGGDASSIAAELMDKYNLHQFSDISNDDRAAPSI